MHFINFSTIPIKYHYNIDRGFAVDLITREISRMDDYELSNLVKTILINKYNKIKNYKYPNDFISEYNMPFSNDKNISITSLTSGVMSDNDFIRDIIKKLENLT